MNSLSDNKNHILVLSASVGAVRWNLLTEPDIAGYWIYRDGSNTPLNETLIDPAVHHFVDIGLTNGRPFQYCVAAQDTSGQQGTLSAAADVIPQTGTGWSGVR